MSDFFWIRTRLAGDWTIGRRHPGGKFHECGNPALINPLEVGPKVVARTTRKAPAKKPAKKKKAA